jgi:hypothetical protein
MKKIEILFNDFFNLNKENKKIKNQSDILKILKGWSITEISSEEKYWSREITVESVLLGFDGFGGCFIFSDTKFFYKSSGFSKTYFVESIENFLKIGGYPKSTFKSGSITYDNSSIGNISTSKNDIFEIIEKIKKDVIGPYLETKDNIEEFVEANVGNEDLIGNIDIMNYLFENFQNFKQSSPGLLGYEDVIELSNKTFSLSHFSMKKEFIKLINYDNFLFAFNFGIIITKEKILFHPGVSNTIEIEFEEINKIKVLPDMLKVFFGQNTILLKIANIEHAQYFMIFQKIFSQGVIQKITERKNELQIILEIEEKLKLEKENNNKIKLFEELRKSIYDEKSDLDAYRYYFSNIKSIETESKWGWKNGRMEHLKHFYSHIDIKNYFFISGGLFFSDLVILYIFPVDGISFQDKFLTKDGSSRYNFSLGSLDSVSVKYFLETYYPYGIDKDHMNEEPIKSTLQIIKDFIHNCLDIRIQKSKDISENLEKERITSLNSKRGMIISNLDKDGNGEVDLVDGDDFNKILNLNQKAIIDLDRSYIQKFVKISNYLKTKRVNTQKIFSSLNNTKTDSELELLTNLLKNQIYFYDLLVFHSVSMITSLIEQDLITFYEIYECFDQFGIFNSNWENEVTQKLTDINQGIKELMFSIYHMEKKIVNSINNLSYLNQDSFRILGGSIEKQLNSVNSSIRFNNLLNTVQTYKMFTIE